MLISNAIMIVKRVAGRSTPNFQRQIPGAATEARHGAGMKSSATTPQIMAVAFVSVLVLATSMAGPANWVNLTLSARCWEHYNAKGHDHGSRHAGGNHA
jgi:hypothetical protein